MKYFPPHNLQKDKNDLTTQRYKTLAKIYYDYIDLHVLYSLYCLNRLISIESQPKKVVLVVVFVVVIFVVVIIGHKNLIIKFDQNWVNNR